MQSPSWSPLSSHGQALLYLARFPDARQIDMSRQLPMDLRTVVRVIGELKAAGVVRVARQGRRNTYHVLMDAPLAGPHLTGFTVRDLLGSLLDTTATTTAPPVSIDAP